MQRYANRSGNSGVIAFEVGKNSMTVEFFDGTYLYNHENPGRDHCQRMIELARAGIGLATYINQHVRDNYAAKLK